ncbi:MAG TPA: hypothetical protein VJ813_00695 [Vicinamibacterales bacterium]|nr:hypothetical protein [Vicinamibacterales bacterium]
MGRSLSLAVRRRRTWWRGRSSEEVARLVIDPKPFVGDPAYDATQHLLLGKTPLRPG